jgi:hypothetical protein
LRCFGSLWRSGEASASRAERAGMHLMPQLELSVTEQIDLERANRLARKLRDHLELAGPHTLVRRGVEPSAIPQFIKLIGEAVPWLALLYAAKVFLKSYLETLGSLAAHASRDGLADLLKKGEVKPLADVAAALADAREGSSGRIEIVVGLNIPDPHFGTALHITANSPEEIAHALALFVTRAEELSTTMQAEVEAGRAPFGRALVTLEEDGGLSVRWWTKDFVRHVKRIS